MHIWQPFGLDFTRRQIPRIVGPLLAACSARAFGYIAVRPLPAKMSSVPWFTVKVVVVSVTVLLVPASCTVLHHYANNNNF